MSETAKELLEQLEEEQARRKKVAAVLDQIVVTPRDLQDMCKVILMSEDPSCDVPTTLKQYPIFSKCVVTIKHKFGSSDMDTASDVLTYVRNRVFELIVSIE